MLVIQITRLDPVIAQDLAFCLTEAKRHGLQLHCAEHVDNAYAQLQQQGENRSDTSVLIKQYDI